MNKGFTLIEMIVAVGVFTVAITLSLASFLNISAIQKKAEAFRLVNNNLNFALEAMVREIKTGSNYSSIDGSSLIITNSSEINITFFLENNQIKRQIEGDDPLALTTPEVQITNLQFIMKPPANPQPMVTVLINGVIEEKGEIKSHLDLQTTISQRKLE
ncbi:MAG: type II secretion system protein [Candidatus Terrybacteria bacterium]|nr:type II secretion system protein [Candidatus Terrybacteria bacterium]